jgi:putative membrane protein
MSNDPNVFFSAERTLLSWIRTGVTTIGLGFVVARFGFVLRVVEPEKEASTEGLSGKLGVALVVLGSLACASGAIQFARFARGLPKQQQAPRYSAIPSVVLSLGLSVIGVLMAIYLLG